MSMSLLEFHVLLALADGALHGWAVAERVSADSDGGLSPRAGSLYRVIARLMNAGYVAESRGDTGEPHPGLPRRYYALTAPGRKVLAAHRSTWDGFVNAIRLITELERA